MVEFNAARRLYLCSSLGTHDGTLLAGCFLRPSLDFSPQRADHKLCSVLSSQRLYT
jgi:hypothetical protein